MILYLALVFAVPLVLSGAVGWRGLPRGRRCPECAADSVPLRMRGVQMLSALLPGTVLQRRWCIRCGWSGFTRVPRARLPKSGGRGVSAPARAATKTLSIRSLAVNGEPYQVLLQCWQQAGYHFGRLVFIDPAGRLWLDSVQPIGGLTADDVVRQARGIPDLLLTSRVRLLASS